MPAFLRTSTVLGIGPTLRHSLSNLTTSEVILMIMKLAETGLDPCSSYMLPTELTLPRNDLLSRLYWGA